MENTKVFIDGIEKNVFGLFYIYDSKYYFIYTEKEIDENDYVILYMTQVGKETKNTENGLIDTGFMVGVEISDPEEQKKVQTSVSLIVEDKKNNTTNPQIQYLPMSMLSNLKIVSKKRFRLLKSIMVDNFKLNFEESVLQSEAQINLIQPVEPQLQQSNLETVQPIAQINDVTSNVNSEITTNQNLEPQKVENSGVIEQENKVIIDYRAKYFEEEEKNKELEARIDLLTQKLEEIKKIIE